MIAQAEQPGAAGAAGAAGHCAPFAISSLVGEFELYKGDVSESRRL